MNFGCESKILKKKLKRDLFQIFVFTRPENQTKNWLDKK